jgi:hypothetical protein
MTVSATPKGPLKRFQELWRADEAKAFLAIYRTHWIPDMADVPVYGEEPVVCSDLLLASNGRESHYELYGIDLDGVGESWVSDSRVGRVRIPQDDGTWRWEKESALLQPEPDPVPKSEPEPIETEPEPEPAPGPAPAPLPRSASEAIPGIPNPPGDTPVTPTRDPQYIEPREDRTSPARRWGNGPGRDW